MDQAADLERQFELLREKRDAPIQDTPFTPRLPGQSGRDRRKNKQLLIQVSSQYNDLAMSCLSNHPDLAFELLQRALAAAPTSDLIVVKTMGSLGVAALQRGKVKTALRYLRQSVLLEGPHVSSLDAGFRARARLNLCAGLNTIGEYQQALDYAEQAVTLLTPAPPPEPVSARRGARSRPSPRTAAAAAEPFRATAGGPAALEAAGGGEGGGGGGGGGGGSSSGADWEVLRAIALHNCCACHEFLGQFSMAHQQAKRALKVAEAALGAGDELLTRLSAVVRSVAEKDRESLARAARARKYQQGELPSARRSVVTEEEQQLAQISRRRGKKASRGGLLSLMKPTAAQKASAAELKLQTAEKERELLRMQGLRERVGTRDDDPASSPTNQVSDRLTQMTKGQQMGRGLLAPRKAAPAPDAKRRKGRTSYTPPKRFDDMWRLGKTYQELGVYGVRRFLQMQLHCKEFAQTQLTMKRGFERMRRAHAMRIIKNYLKLLLEKKHSREPMSPKSPQEGAERSNGLISSGRILGRARSKLGAVDEEGRSLLPGGLKRGTVKNFRALRQLLASDEHLVVSALKGKSALSMMTMQRAYKKMGGQTLRIFLSSTFRDMNVERDVFVRRYVPALRQRCAELGLHISIIDLRWGVTVEQAQTGEVVPICMSEVEACQYFACFLGARYGWRPGKNDVPEFAYQRFPFLNSYIPGRSVTECEILYGALGWGADSRVPCKRAFFYVRQDSYLDSLGEEGQSAAFSEKDAFGRKNLRDLKRRLEARYKESEEFGGGSASGARLPIVECMREYYQPEKFAEHLHADLVQAIEKDYAHAAFRPKNDIDREFVAHVSYAKPLVRVYEGQSHVYAAIERYAIKGFFTPEKTKGEGAEQEAAGSAAAFDDDSDEDESASPQASSPSKDSVASPNLSPNLSPKQRRGFSFASGGGGGGQQQPYQALAGRPPLIVYGAAGSGKSAALAHWLLHHERPGFVLAHFIGSTANSTDHVLLVRRILIELKRAFRLEGDVPTDPKTTLELFPLWLGTPRCLLALRRLAAAPTSSRAADAAGAAYAADATDANASADADDDAADAAPTGLPCATPNPPLLLTPVSSTYLQRAERACQNAPVVILIDGVDQLIDADGNGAQRLNWLPTSVPRNCTLVLSVTSGSAAHKACERREGWKKSVSIEK